MTKNEKYWQARTAQRMWEHMQSAEETADQVAKVYAKASLYLSREIQDIFKKYVEKHHLTEKEALQLLNTLRIALLSKNCVRGCRVAAKNKRLQICLQNWKLRHTRHAYRGYKSCKRR